MKVWPSCLERFPAVFFALSLTGVLIFHGMADAKVVRIEVTSRKVVSKSPDHSRSGPYELIKGMLYLEVDPENPANHRIVDLNRAKHNSRGNVEFSTEFELDALWILV